MKKTVVVGLVLIFCQVVCFHVTMAQKSNMPIAFMPKLPLLQNRSYGQTNITSTNKHESVSVIWKKLNAAFLNHPDAGFVDKYRPSNKVVELFEKRTANSKYFVHADTLSKFYQVKSNTALHYLKDGQWLTIDERLEPISKYIFEASRQEEPVGFNVKKQHAYIKTIKGQAFFNNWYLYGLVDGKQEMLSMPNWSLCKLGDQCVYITNIFPGIDAEMLIGRGFIKTSFIIKANFFPQATQLIFKDAFSAHNKASLKANTTLDNQIQTLDYVINGEEALHIDKAVAYSESEVQESAIDLFYSFSADTLSFAVSAQYINLNLQRGRVIVDPLISTSNSISQATITGSMDCGSYNFSCNYSMTVPSPPKTTITDVYFMFGFQTVGSALNKNGFWSIKSGTCGVWVLADSTKAAYNLPGTTSTFGSYDQITPFLINCMPAPSCISIDIPFTLGFYNNICTTGSACSENYIKANEPFVIMIEGRTVELFSIGASKDTICEGDQVTLTAQGIWGVPPYTYSWDNGGGAGQTVTVNPTTTTTYTLTITDQCGNTASGTVLVVVKPSPTNVIPSITSNSPVCEFADLQLSAATIIGATYNWTGPNGFSSNDQNPVYTNVPSSASGDYTLFVTLNGCSSQTSTIPVVVNSSVASVSISASATVISEGTTVTFTATPVNGGVSPSYQWKVNGVNVGTNSAAFTSNTLINNDVVSCTMTGSDPCTSAIPSNLITIKVVRVDNISDQTLCNGASTTAINFTGTGSSYTWTNDNPAIGLAESGTENIPSFTVVNNGSEPDTAVVTVTPKGGEMFAYVANQGTNTVSVIDLVENKVLKTIVVGNHPIGLVYSPLHNRIYVVQDMSNQICVINAETYAVLQNIPVGNNPGTVALSLDEKYLYVSNETSNTISVINTFTNTVVSTIPAIGNPRALALSVDGSLLYVGNTTANTVSVINTSTNTEVANIVVGTFPVRICVSPDGRYVYVTNRVSNSVSVIDAISNLLIATISVGLSPYCFTLSPDFQKLYVANSESNTVSIINTSTNVVESTFSTATRPFGIVSSKFFDKVYISNFSYFSTFNTTLNTIDSIKTSGIFYGDVVLNERFTSGTPKTFMIIVNPTKVPTININASATSICAGTTVTFNAAITNGGSSPVYQWKVNGANVGTNSSTYSSSTLKNNDIITCVLTSNETCASPTVVTSNSITMKVNQPTTSTTIKTVCPQALPYVWNANSYTVAGSYTAHFTN
ncbi:MAG: beta-propeller fold lactonase family protein, partial [Paludibacteraceae bacterium]|nr:beta-propeller fold lactonase family protein [Paludibacteraceae bacterium]